MVDLRTLLEELRLAKRELADPLEGFQDILSLNVSSETSGAARVLQDAFRNRARLLDAVIAAIEALLADRYPELPKQDSLPGVLSNIDEQLRTIEAARAFFVPEIATVATGTFGEVRRKDP